MPVVPYILFESPIPSEKRSADNMLNHNGVALPLEPKYIILVELFVRYSTAYRLVGAYVLKAPHLTLPHSAGNVIIEYLDIPPAQRSDRSLKGHKLY